MILVTDLIDYVMTYPAITKEPDLSAFYRKKNKSFATSFSIFIVAIILGQFAAAFTALLDCGTFDNLCVNLVLWTVADSVCLAMAYCSRRLLDALQKNKKNKELQSSVRHIFLAIGLLPTCIFMATPAVFPLMNIQMLPGTMTDCWLITWILVLHNSTWAVGGILYKLAMAGMYNVVFCTLAYTKGYFSDVYSKAILPVLTAFFVILTLDRNEKETFLLKQAKKAQRNTLQSFMLYAMEPIYIFEKENEILFKNKASETRMGNFIDNEYSVVAETGRTLKDNIEAAYLNEPGTSHKEKYMYHPGGSLFAKERKVVNVTLVTFMKGTNDRKVVGAITSDITEELIGEEKKTEKKYNDMLLFSLSHELKTPLNIFQRFLTEAKSFTLEEKDKALLKDAKGSWGYLKNKINDILDYIQIISGSFALHISRFSLSRFVKHLKNVSYCLLMNKRRQIQLNFEVDKNLDDECEGDNDRLEQVLFNFLSNSIRFTSIGSISLRVFSAGEKLIKFEVSDTGSGMSRKASSKLFKLRSPKHAKSSSSSTVEGFKMKSTRLCGFGLTISRMICTQMGSDINVSTAIGKGSTFSFTISYVRSPEKIINLTDEDEVPDEEVRVHTRTLNDENAFKFLHTMHDTVPKRLPTEPLRLNLSTGEPKLLITLRRTSEEPSLKAGPATPEGSQDSFPSRININKIEYVDSPGNVERPDCRSAIVYEEAKAGFEEAPMRRLTYEGSLLKLSPYEISPRIVIDEIRRNSIKILVVDDNDFNREVIVAMAKKLGFGVDEADNGKKAMEAVKRIQNDNKDIIVFMDINMPVMDGIEATIQIRKQDKTPRPYIVALTAFSSENERKKCFDAGMDHFISKPLTKAALHDLFHYKLKII